MRNAGTLSFYFVEETDDKITLTNMNFEISALDKTKIKTSMLLENLTVLVLLLFR